MDETRTRPEYAVLSADLPIGLYERLEQAANRWFQGDMDRMVEAASYVALSKWEEEGVEV